MGELTSIIVSVQTDDAFLSLRDGIAKQLDLVGVSIWLGDLDRGGQVLASVLFLRRGRTKIIRSSFRPSANTLSFPASHVFLTASHTSTQYSVSV